MTNPVGYNPEKITFSTLKPIKIDELDPPQSGGSTTAPVKPGVPTSPTQKPTGTVRADTRKLANANENRVRRYFEANFVQPADNGGDEDWTNKVVRDPQGYIVRDPDKYRAGAEPYRQGAEKAIAEVAKGRSSSPVYVGHWSSVDERGNPVFFQNIPSDQNPTSQVYSYWDSNKSAWSTYEVGGNFYKAYADPGYTNGHLGTGSGLGYPTSNAAKVDQRTSAPFLKDPQVAKRIADRGNVTYQEFEGGYLVDLGNGTLLAYDKNGGLGLTFNTTPPIKPGTPY